MGCIPLRTRTQAGPVKGRTCSKVEERCHQLYSCLAPRRPPPTPFAHKWPAMSLATRSRLGQGSLSVGLTSKLPVRACSSLPLRLAEKSLERLVKLLGAAKSRLSRLLQPWPARRARASLCPSPGGTNLYQQRHQLCEVYPPQCGLHWSPGVSPHQLCDPGPLS